MTETPADRSANSPSKRRWPERRLNRIAASVGIAAATVAVAAAVFVGGVMAGVQSSDVVGVHHRFGHQPETSAQREGTPTEQIWIIPEGATAIGYDGYIAT